MRRAWPLASRRKRATTARATRRFDHTLHVILQLNQYSVYHYSPDIPMPAQSFLESPSAVCRAILFLHEPNFISKRPLASVRSAYEYPVRISS